MKNGDWNDIYTMAYAGYCARTMMRNYITC